VVRNRKQIRQNQDAQQNTGRLTRRENQRH
jgi:hypothetical protein